MFQIWLVLVLIYSQVGISQTQKMQNALYTHAQGRKSIQLLFRSEIIKTALVVITEPDV